jgi:hypothetical protein
MSNVKVHEFMSNVNVYMLVAVFYLRCDRNLFKFSVLYNKISSIFFQKDNKFLLTTANCLQKQNLMNNIEHWYLPISMRKKTRALYCICDESYGLRTRACKRLRGPGIDSSESIPPAWQARTTNRVVVPACQARNRFLAP